MQVKFAKRISPGPKGRSAATRRGAILVPPRSVPDSRSASGRRAVSFFTFFGRHCRAHIPGGERTGEGVGLATGACGVRLEGRRLVPSKFGLTESDAEVVVSEILGGCVQ
jgi:hypothetical protein